MTRTKKIQSRLAITVCGSLFILGLSGCDAALTDYVREARPGNTIETPGEVISQGPTALKVSPGQMRASNGAVSVVGNVTATNKFMSSPEVSARMTINRSRTSQ